ncbi:MAG: hypothetical protein IIB56_04260, partial [Planctomycetes bacterium]|nr:hypothetical protein [Planctomycetota bacterium]
GQGGRDKIAAGVAKATLRTILTRQRRHRTSLGDRVGYSDRLLINKLFNVSYFLDPQHLILGSHLIVDGDDYNRRGTGFQPRRKASCGVRTQPNSPAGGQGWTCHQEINGG